MTEFEALVRSLGEHLVSYIGKDHLRRLSVSIDEATLSATADICLASDDFSMVMEAIERVGEVRLMFMDELSFDYVLSGPEDCSPRSTSRQRDLVFA
ncbi:hypothetical protein GCM10009616_28750 [Microlunatus lacustris]